MQRGVVPLVLTLMLAGCAGGDDVASRAPAPAASSAPPDAPVRTGPLGEGGTSASCVESYNPSTIDNRAFAFDGTVLAIGPGGTNKADSGSLDTAAVTFEVNEWFKGGSGQTVTVDVMSPGASISGEQVPAYEEGTRLLVSGEPRWGGEPLDDAIAWSCGGFTRYYEQAVADEWRRATS